MKILNKILGDPNKKIIKSLEPIVNKINNLENDFKKLDNRKLAEYTDKFKKQIKDSKNEKDALDKILPEAFAVVREAARRTLGMRHYDVQLIGGIVLHRGEIAEMKTGEGKTLVATLPLYLNALTGKGAQLITVNDYLSQVGAGWMAPIYHFLGLSTGVIIHDNAFIYDPEYLNDNQFDERLKNFRPVERKEAYRCDILYGTNNEFGFDYLRDNMAPSLDKMVQRELNYAIVDEVDSILIDEARTPLIISAPAEESTDKYFKFAQLVGRLKENEDYNIDEKMRAATLTEEGINKMEKFLGVDNIYVEGGIRDVHHIEQALKARVLFKRDRDYVVKDGEVIIVDEFTGRLMPGRRYSEGLHQAIEAKENLEIKKESQTLATITFQNYFRMYDKLAGMTGTAMTESEEFFRIYGLETVAIPTHKPVIRKDLNDLIYRTEAGKFKAVIREVKERHKKGQPILIGTISIEKNELLADMMEKEGLKPQVLNAKQHAKEAQIIAQAGKKGAITIATNMAGRGVDIILGGSPFEQKNYEEVVNLGGLHIIGTERHESRRIDNQLRGRAGRQGDPGSSQFYVSMEDDLMRIFGGDRIKKIMSTLRLPEDVPIENKIISRSIEAAQTKVEGNNFDIRKHLVEYDDVINKHREAIYKKRRNILKEYEKPSDESLTKIIFEMIESEIEQMVSFHTATEKIEDWNIEEIYQVASTIFPAKKELKVDLENMTFDSNNKMDKAKVRTNIIESLVELAKDYYKEVREKIEDLDIKWKDIEKGVLIRSIDTLWIEHLEAMAHMRQGIGLRGYGQRDPLVEYKKEAYHLFNELNNLINKQVVYSIFKVGLGSEVAAQQFSSTFLANRKKQFSAPAKTSEDKNSSFSQAMNYEKGSSSSSIDLVPAKLKNDQGKKIGRNDPCPCGSGKKYKKCCGK